MWHGKTVITPETFSVSALLVSEGEDNARGTEEHETK
jgi:hypothetical protein